MSLMLYFLRHGQTAFSRDNDFCGSGTDPELTTDGLAMAKAFAAAYRTTSWNAIYSSPLQRAVATAQPLAASQQTALQTRLQQMTGKRVNLNFKIDPEIIGGVVTRIGSTVYDGSVKNQLQHLKEKMIRS